MKKLIVCICLSFFLISCGSDDASPESKGLTVFSWDQYSISIPSNWKILNDKENVLPEPNNGKIELSAQSQDLKWGFLNNVLVLSDKLERFTNSQDYSMANNVGAKREYLEYLELNNEVFTFADGEQSHVYEFEAKYNMQTPKLKFIQTAYVCQPNTGYLLTIAISPSIKKTDKYKEFLSTFTCNSQEAEEEK